MSTCGIGDEQGIAGELVEPWVEARESIPFRLGVNLFSWSFPALRREPSFAGLSRPQRESEIPDPLLRKGVEALVVIPCPAELAGLGGSRVRILANAIRYVPVARTNFYISLRGDFAGYLSHLSGKARHEFLRKRRRFIELAEGIDPMIREYRTKPAAEEFYRLARTLSVKTYQSHIGVGIPDEPRFKAHLIEEAARDRLRGFILFLKDRPVAFGLSIIKGDILLYMKTGYDPEFCPYSPGAVLLYGMLAHSFADQRCSVMDLGVGEAQWKRMYCTEERTVSEVYYFRKRPANLALAIAHNAITALSDFGGRLLTRLHLKERYRKLIRSTFTN